jgi:putative integral membrane protein (TIGR02587 family)
MAAPSGQWVDEATAVARAAAGGMLFGIPLLYTMEIWWTGSHTTPAQMLGVLAVTCVPVFLLNRTAGFRSTADVRLRDAVMDTVEAVGLGLILVTMVLFLFREITLDTPPAVGLGKVVYEVMPFCIGIAVANHFLSRGRDSPDDSGSKNGPTINPTLVDIGATLIGAVFIALNIAPTDEIFMLAATMSPQWLLAVMAASLLVSYAIVFVAGFGDQDKRHAQVGIFQRPSTETVACYLVALFASALMLWFFQRASTPAPFFLKEVVVLGLPATIGGAAGRLAI